MHLAHFLHREQSANAGLGRCLGCFFLMVALFLAAGLGPAKAQPPFGFSPVLSNPQERTPVEANEARIDRHALKAPREVEASLDRLVQYLVGPARCDWDKARALFRWMTDRIDYDVDAFLTGHPGETRAFKVFQDRKGTCYGITALFEAMARRAGLEVATIHGHAKMKHFNEDGRFMKVKHAWNAVKIDGAWQLLDVTWGAGIMKNQRFYKIFQEQYFLTPPPLLLYTHLPVDPRWQLVPVPVTAGQFDALPPAKAGFFGMGLTHEGKWQEIHGPDYRGIVGQSDTQFYLYGGRVKVVAAPSRSPLYKGYTYPFLIESHYACQMALCNNDRWLILHKNGTRFEAQIRPEPGDLKLLLKSHPEDQRWQTVMTFAVE